MSETWQFEQRTSQVSCLSTVVEHALCRRCLASVDVSDDANVTDVFDVGFMVSKMAPCMSPSPIGELQASSSLPTAISANSDVAESE